MAISSILQLFELFAPWCVLITPHANTEIASIVTLIFQALSWCIAQPSSRDDRQEARLSLFVNVYCWADMLMCRIVAVCARCGDFDLRLWLRFRGFTSNVTGLENYGEALAGRRRDTFGRAFIFDGLMSVRTLVSEVIHSVDEFDDLEQVLVDGRQ